MAAKTAQLKYLAKVTLGKMLQPAESIQIDQEMKPYLKASSITTSGLNLDALQEMPFSSKEQSHLDLRKNDVVVVEGGSIGRSAYIKEDLPGIHFQNSVNRVRPLPGNDGRYINYALMVLEQSGYFESITNQATIRHLTAEKLERVPIPVRSFEEQKRIADELDRKLAEVDELINNFESFHKVLRERYESELEELLNIELSNIPHQKLSWHVEFMNGDRGISYPSRDEFVQSGVPFVNAGHLREGTVDFSEMNYISEAKYQSMGGTKLRNEDVLYCLRGSVGKCGIYPQNHGALASSLVALRTKDQLLPKFLLLLLSSRNIQLHIDTLLTGSAQPNLSVEQLASVRIPVPDVSQQLRIVKRNDENKLTFKSLDESTGMLALLSERKTALLESYLSGEKNG